MEVGKVEEMLHKNGIYWNHKHFLLTWQYSPSPRQRTDLGMQCRPGLFRLSTPHPDKERSYRLKQETDRQLLHVVSVHHAVTVPQSSPFADFMWKGNCVPGQLTERGAKQQQRLGHNLRSIYVDQ
jgi:hypothetical protein